MSRTYFGEKSCSLLTILRLPSNPPSKEDHVLNKHPFRISSLSSIEFWIPLSPSHVAGHIDLGGGQYHPFPSPWGARILYKKQVHNKNYVINNPLGGRFMSVFSFGGISPVPPPATCLPSLAWTSLSNIEFWDPEGGGYSNSYSAHLQKQHMEWRLHKIFVNLKWYQLLA